MTGPDIAITGLTVRFGDEPAPAVDDVCVVLRAQSVNGLIGESGCGKSVLGMSILGLLPATAQSRGTIVYQDHDLLKMRPNKLRRLRGREIGLIPQNPSESLNPVLKIGLQMREAIRVAGVDRRCARQETRAQLAELGFGNPDEIVARYPFQLSGGMKQRVLTAMGIACTPEWVIADEPTKGLDAMLRKRVFALLKDITATRIQSMIVITHDLLLARQLCDTIYVMYRGQIVEEGPAQLVTGSPLHPYTEALMAAIPARGMKPLTARRDEAPTAGCRFADRCPYARPNCSSEAPPLVAVTENRKARCFYALGGSTPE